MRYAWSFGRFQPQVVALFEFLGQEGLFELDAEDDHVVLRVAEDLDLVLKGQRIVHRIRSHRGGERQARQKTAKNEAFHRFSPPFRRTGWKPVLHEDVDGVLGV